MGNLQASTLRSTALAGAIDEIGALADSQYREAEEACRLSEEVYERSIGAGLFRQVVPDGSGSADDVVEWFDNSVRAACWDGSFGWVIAQGSYFTTALHAGAPELAARLEERDGFPIAATNAGVLEGKRISDKKYSLSGSVPFNSGCDGAAGMMVQFAMSDRRPGRSALRLAYAPADRWEIVRNWDVTGLRGTGSHATVANGLVVDVNDTINQFGPAEVDGPTRIMWMGDNGSWPIAAAVAATQLGIARRALDEAHVVTKTKKPPPLFDLLDDRPTVRRDLMEAEGRWHQAISSVRAALADAWETGLANEDLDDSQRATLSTSTYLANRDSAEIVDVAARVVGTASMRADHPVARCARDVRPLLGHVVSNDAVLGFAAARWRGEDPRNIIV